MTNLTCEDLTPERLPDYLDFFDTRAFTDNPRWSGCYCYFPIHDPGTCEWPLRTSRQNREAICSAVEARRARGVLAYLDGKVVGWCSAGPWSMYPMLLQDFPDENAESLGAIFCFVVAPELRGRGIGSALLAAACDSLRRQGLKRVQAKPRKTADSAAENHLGPLSMYLAAGFRVLRETPEGDVFVVKSLVS